MSFSYRDTVIGFTAPPKSYLNSYLNYICKDLYFHIRSYSEVWGKFDYIVGVGVGGILFSSLLQGLSWYFQVPRQKARTFLRLNGCFCGSQAT